MAKKKILASFLAAATIFGAAIPAQALTAKDALNLLKRITSKTTTAADDYNGDGKVTAKDVLAMLKDITGGTASSGGAPVIASRTKPEDYDTAAVAFKSKIGKFNAQVNVESSATEDGYSKRKLFVDGIPIIEWVKKDGTPKPVVFVLHGGGGQKSDYNLPYLADKGFCAVAIDCAGSGESKDGPIQAPAVFAETVHDIDVLVEYYNTLDYCDATKFGIAGYSMGGNIALNYIPHGKYKPTAIAITASTPDPLLTEGPIYDCCDKGKNWQPSVWTDEQITTFITAYKPINFPEYFKDIWVFASNGADDSVAGPPDGNAALKAKVEALGGTKFTHTVYKGFGHDVPESWYNETLPKFAAVFGN